MEVRVHFVLIFVWAGLIIPTILWWKESILWVAFMSLYANIAGHWAAFDAAKTEKRQKEMES
jgi:hypothetical protein